MLIERNQQAPMSDEYPLMAFIANEGVAPKGERYDRSALVTDTVNKLYKKTEKGDFIYSSNNLETGSIGLNKYGKACISPVYSIFEPTGIADSDFLGRRLVRKDFINAMVKWRQGVIYGQWRIHESDFLKIEIPVPSVEEQRKIGAYLDQLDNLITLHQRECISFTARAGRLILTANKKRNTSSWEQRKLGDVVKEITRNDPESEAPIMMITANNGFIEQSERYAFNNAGESLKKYILLKKGELAYNHGASKLRPYGSCFALTTAENARIPFVYHCFSAENQNAEFMSIELNGAEIENQLRKIVSSGARMDGLLNISFDEYTSVSVILPGTEEQDRIADFFRHLDILITLHQRKFEKLTNVKKSMLEKMFPQNGSSYPEIRFKGFTDPWEQRKVLDLLELLTDYDANGSFADMAKNINTTDGDGYAWYVRITDLENPKPLSELKYVDESSYEFLKKTELHGGELLMAKRGNIGKVYIFEPRTKYATVAPNMYLLKLNNKVIPHFLYDYFVSEEGNKKLTRLNASSTMGALYKDDVKNIDVIMPSIEEQAMIGNFFQSIDHIITLHQRLYF